MRCKLKGVSEGSGMSEVTSLQNLSVWEKNGFQDFNPDLGALFRKA